MNANATNNQRFSQTVRDFLATSDTFNASSLARAIGIGETAVRGWVNENRSPLLNDLMANRNNVPTDLMRAVLQELAGSRFQIVAVDVVRDAEIAVVRKAFAVTAATNQLLEAAVEITADGRVDAHEKSRALKLASNVGQAVFVFVCHITAAVGVKLPMRALCFGKSE